MSDQYPDDFMYYPVKNNANFSKTTTPEKKKNVPLSAKITGTSPKKRQSNDSLKRVIKNTENDQSV